MYVRAGWYILEVTKRMAIPVITNLEAARLTTFNREWVSTR
jgi:hypothetical protein